jgi:ribosomal protein L11
MLTEQQRQKLDSTRQMAKEEIEQLDKEIAAELAKVKERLIQLQQAKKAMKQIYDGACARMGVKPTLEMAELNITDLVRHA